MQKIDHNLLKANQIAIITLNIVAFVFNLAALAALVGVIMLAGAALGKAFFGLLIKRIAPIPADAISDNPEPHRFAQGLGGLFMLGGAAALFAGAPVLGWGLVWMVAALAALNAFGGFCVGCFVYYWLTRFGVPGFSKNPPAGTFPGQRPRREAHP